MFIVRFEHAPGEVAALARGVVQGPHHVARTLAANAHARGQDLTAGLVMQADQMQSHKRSQSQAAQDLIAPAQR